MQTSPRTSAITDLIQGTESILPGKAFLTVDCCAGQVSLVANACRVNAPRGAARRFQRWPAARRVREESRTHRSVGAARMTPAAPPVALRVPAIRRCIGPVTVLVEQRIHVPAVLPSAVQHGNADVTSQFIRRARSRALKASARRRTGFPRHKGGQKAVLQ